MSADNYNGVEQNTRSFLNSLQQNPGPPNYTLLPDKARAILTGLQVSKAPVQKLPAWDLRKRKVSLLTVIRIITIIISNFKKPIAI